MLRDFKASDLTFEMSKVVQYIGFYVRHFGSKILFIGCDFVVSKSHYLFIGFSDFAPNVLSEYFTLTSNCKSPLKCTRMDVQITEMFK
jgi:hypothetical protein